MRPIGRVLGFMSSRIWDAHFKPEHSQYIQNPLTEYRSPFYLQLFSVCVCVCVCVCVDVDEINMGGLFHKRLNFLFLCKSFDPVKCALSHTPTHTLSRPQNTQSNTRTRTPSLPHTHTHTHTLFYL